MLFYRKIFVLSIALVVLHNACTHTQAFTTTLPNHGSRISRHCQISSSSSYSARFSSSNANFNTSTNVNVGAGANANVNGSAGSDGDAAAVPPAQLPQPTNFREAEVLGLRLMQEGQFEQALTVFQQGLKLPGSRTDIIRKQNISGPSPVGGSSGGTEGKVVQTLDEFEYQAAHYNIACAFASLNQVENSCKSLEQAFNYGFDNYATVRADPDLENVHGSPEFDNLMERFDSKKGFFGLFK